MCQLIVAENPQGHGTKPSIGSELRCSLEQRTAAGTLVLAAPRGAASHRLQACLSRGKEAKHPPCTHQPHPAPTRAIQPACGQAACAAAAAKASQRARQGGAERCCGLAGACQHRPSLPSCFLQVWRQRQARNTEV